MREYVTDAIVLKKEDLGELDVKFSFFTKNFGKLKAKAKSAKKITSKLAGHLEPGSLAKVKFVEKNGLNLTDALAVRRIGFNPADLYYLDDVLAEGEPDHELWQIINSEAFSWKNTLKILGWDPELAYCGSCSAKKELVFLIKTQEFFCGNCSDLFPKNGGFIRID